MTRKSWTLPPSTPIVDGRATPAQISGLLVLGLALGLILAWLGTVFANSQRQPDPLNESGPWVVSVPGAAGKSATMSLNFSVGRSQLQTGCGDFEFVYSQKGTAVEFSSLPDAPEECTGNVGASHDWLVSQLAAAKSFGPSEFWRTSGPPTITLRDAGGGQLVSLTVPNIARGD